MMARNFDVNVEQNGKSSGNVPRFSPSCSPWRINSRTKRVRKYDQNKRVEQNSEALSYGMRRYIVMLCTEK